MNNSLFHRLYDLRGNKHSIVSKISPVSLPNYGIYKRKHVLFGLLRHSISAMTLETLFIISSLSALLKNPLIKSILTTGI